jgi:hypothetical protein
MRLYFVDEKCSSLRHQSQAAVENRNENNIIII